VPWVGKYWSSRNTAAIGRPKVPDATSSRSARNTGAERRTSPDCAGTPAAATASTSHCAPARPVASGFSQKIGRSARTAASTALRWATVGVQIQTASHCAMS
jgi:hypothetical protein